MGGRLLMVTMLAAAGAVSAGGETTMDETRLDGLLTGNTLYLNVPPGGAAGPDGAIVPFRYGADGSASARLSDETTLVGTWSIDGERYCVDWDDGPKGSCTTLVKGAEAITLVDAATGEARGTVERIVPGNPEGL